MNNKIIKFITCDDNAESLEIASKTITKVMMNYDIEYKICKFTKYTDKLKEIINDEFNIKIYILDIELPLISGLEIASEIREIDDNSTIIFVTAHSECKNDVFYSRLQAIDFISKYHRYDERLEQTIDHILKKIYKDKTLNFTYNYVYNKLLYKEINYIEKLPSQNKCLIHLANGEEKQIGTTITKLKEELKPIFHQTHKSCLVNLTNIKYIDYANFTIYFKNGNSTNLLTPSARKELKKHVTNY